MIEVLSWGSDETLKYTDTNTQHMHAQKHVYVGTHLCGQNRCIRARRSRGSPVSFGVWEQVSWCCRKPGVVSPAKSDDGCLLGTWSPQGQVLWCLCIYCSLKIFRRSHCSGGQQSDLPPKLVTSAWSLKPTWWKERDDSCKMTSDLHTPADTACLYLNIGTKT